MSQYCKYLFSGFKMATRKYNTASDSGNCTSQGIGIDVTGQWLPDVSTRSRIIVLYIYMHYSSWQNWLQHFNQECLYTYSCIERLHPHIQGMTHSSHHVGSDARKVQFHHTAAATTSSSYWSKSTYIQRQFESEGKGNLRSSGPWSQIPADGISHLHHWSWSSHRRPFSANRCASNRLYLPVHLIHL